MGSLTNFVRTSAQYKTMYIKIITEIVPKKAINQIRRKLIQVNIISNYSYSGILLLNLTDDLSLAGP